MPYADPEFYEDPDILAILEQAAGGEIVMPELATDTPLKDSEYQVIHRDITLISPDLPTADPAVPFQFGVNFALVDITLENGPFEIAPGTHRLTDQQSRQHIKAGVIEPQLIPLLMRVGDVMLRDVRALHRGTPNSTDVPRPMVVMGFNRVEHRRPQLRIFIPRQTHEQLSDRARLLLRLNPVVDSLDQAERSETYSNLYFLEEED
jgi:ectoine hydroxylase-related dioxygenase (phytanoyl-CoA dioxygenase family)